MYVCKYVVYLFLPCANMTTTTTTIQGFLHLISTLGLMSPLLLYLKPCSSGQFNFRNSITCISCSGHSQQPPAEGEVVVTTCA